VILDLTEDQVLGLVLDSPTLGRVATRAQDIETRLTAAGVPCDVTVAAHQITVRTHRPAEDATRVIAAGGDWRVSVSGPAGPDGWVDPADATVCASLPGAVATVIVLGRPAVGWQATMGPGDIAVYAPVDMTRLRDLDRDRLGRHVRVISQDPIHAETVTVSDEHEGTVESDGVWRPGQWTTRARNLTVWASAASAADVALSAYLCDDCGAEIPAQPLDIETLCADCRARREETA
jgi:hypothetical protein